jgi:hypothetical protein
MSDIPINKFSVVELTEAFILWFAQIKYIKSLRDAIDRLRYLEYYKQNELLHHYIEYQAYLKIKRQEL